MKRLLSTIIAGLMTTTLAAPSVYAFDNTDEKKQQAVKQETDKKTTSKYRYKKTFSFGGSDSEDKESSHDHGKNNNADQNEKCEPMTVDFSKIIFNDDDEREKYLEDLEQQHENQHSDVCGADENSDINVKFEKLNSRDGFYLGLSAISSVGDDFRYPNHDNGDAEFETDISFRAQFGGFFVESPGLSSRRIHGLYAPSAWGFNFLNDDEWSLDLFYETSVRNIEGLEGIENLHTKKRGGVRATGYFDDSQLQIIFTPYSPDNGDDDGIEASVSYNYEWQVRNVSVYTAVGAHYRSKDVIDSYSVMLNDGKASSNMSSGMSYSAEMGLEYALSTDWVFGSFVRLNTLSDRTKAARNDDVTDAFRAGMLLTYVF
jgi:hypothetical protein